MKYEAIDYWNSPYLEHHGVKGMKWGVRHDRERSGTSLRERLRQHAEERRVRKNEKAIASGDPKKVAKRFSKMSDEEVKRALNRLRDRRTVQEDINYYHPPKDSQKNKGGNQNGGKQKDGIIVSNLKSTAGDVVKNAMAAAVTSVVTGEKFTDAFKKKYGGKTREEKYEAFLQKQADSLKRQSANATNQKRIVETNEWLRQNTIKNEVKKNGDFLKNYHSGQLSTINTTNRQARKNSVTMNDYNRTAALTNLVLKKNSQMPISTINMRSDSFNRRMKRVGPLTNNRYSRVVYDNYTWHDDMDDDSSFLSHYGVKGMKWGVRHDPIRAGKKRAQKTFSKLKKTSLKAVNKAYKVINSVSKTERIYKLASKTANAVGKAASTSVLAAQGAQGLSIALSNPYMAVGVSAAAAIGVGVAGYKAYKKYHSDHLAHYGVKGMKWGVRHDRDKLAKKAKTLQVNFNNGTVKTSKSDWEMIKTKKMEYSYDPKNSSIGKNRIDKTEYKKEKKRNIKDVKMLAGGVLATAGGTAVSAAAIAASINGVVIPGLLTAGLSSVTYGTAAAIVGGGNIIDRKKAVRNEKAYFNNREKTSVLDKKTGLYKKTKSMTPEKDLSKVNPGFGRHNANYGNNCGLCTITYDMRRRGYDVTAALAGTKGGTNYGDVSKMYPGAKHKIIDGYDKHGNYTNKKAIDNLVTELSSQKNTRGDVRVTWTTGGGHSMAYEVDSKGKVRILDGQTNKIYKRPKDVLQYGYMYAYCRLDNLKPNYNLIKKEAVR